MVRFGGSFRKSNGESVHRVARRHCALRPEEKKLLLIRYTMLNANQVEEPFFGYTLCDHRLTISVQQVASCQRSA